MPTGEDSAADKFPDNVVPFMSLEDLATRAAEDLRFYIEGRNDVSRNTMGTLAAKGYIAYWQAQSTKADG